MKHCPMCHEQFDDIQRFCDVDGTRLIDETTLIRSALQQKSVEVNARGLSRPASAIVGAVAGIVLGLGMSIALYLTFRAPDQKSGSQPSSSSPQVVRTVRADQAADSRQPPVSPKESDSDATEAEAEPTASESPAPASTPTTQAKNSTLNTGPIATGAPRPSEGQRAIIKMTDGSSVEADAAWEDSEGIWYRRSGLVSFVQRNKVEAITAAEKPQASAESKTP